MSLRAQKDWEHLVTTHKKETQSGPVLSSCNFFFFFIVEPNQVFTVNKGSTFSLFAK